MIHHTDCGMLTFKDSELRQIVKDRFNGNEEHTEFLSFTKYVEWIRKAIGLFEARTDGILIVSSKVCAMISNLSAIAKSSNPRSRYRAGSTRSRRARSDP